MKDLILVVIISLFPLENICCRTILVKQFILTPPAANNQKSVLASTQNPNPMSQQMLPIPLTLPRFSAFHSMQMICESVITKQNKMEKYVF